jgi:hypothetical protein
MTSIGSGLKVNVNSHWGNFPVIVFQPGAIPVYPVGDKPICFEIFSRLSPE